MNATELLSALVAIPSVSGDEGVIAAWLADYLEKHGLTVQLLDRNVIVRVAGKRPGPTLLFNSHLDVVPPGPHWETDPFVPVICGDRMVGRGCNDAKASVAAMVLATLRMARHPPECGELILAATCEEERGRDGLEKILPSLGRIDAAVIGEPTGLHPAVAQNGLLILELLAVGRAGHAARPHLARNAIDVAVADVQALHSLRWEPTNLHVGAMTLVVTQIQAGTAHNVIPGDCRMVVDVRTIPEIPPAEVVARVKATVQSQVTVRSDRLAPVATPEGARILEAALSANSQGVPFGSPTLSDWAHLKSIPAVKMGPGRSEVSHTANEWVRLPEVERAVDVYDATARYFLQ